MREYLERKRKKRERAIKVTNLIKRLKHANITGDIMHGLQDILEYITSEPVSKKELKRLMHIYNKTIDRCYLHSISELYRHTTWSSACYPEGEDTISMEYREVPKVPCHRFRMGTWKPYLNDHVAMDPKTFLVSGYPLPF